MTRVHHKTLRAAAAALLLAIGCAGAALADPKVIKKVPPEFPEEAVRKKVTDGVLKAKLSIDGSGAVTDVQIVEAMPAKARVFNESAVSALSKWKFEASGKAESVEIKLVFAQE
ncbi:TonB family protein [Aquincola sp. S2]|uniref:TonB family protein n=1 Tax=Pseudaquabacterium terrae TaxID=2732868 RepID=A0ABX2EDJ6_9BURK|nr:TonB family protein [Aquabacterium terrae]NRF66340.1 TonB family protein [Aquabacterium terrae]